MNNQSSLTLFHAFCLLTALLSGPWLGWSGLSWLALWFLSFLKFDFALFTVFFYASFFHKIGVFPDLFFSIKHFHVAWGILVLAEVWRKQCWSSIRLGLLESKPLIPIAGVLFMAVLGGVLNGANLKVFAMTANFMSVLIMMVYLAGLSWTWPLLFRCLFYFAFGVFVQNLANFYNLAQGTFIFELDLMYNNQFAVLNAIAFFYAFALCLAGPTAAIRRLSFLFSLLIFMALLLSCSRSAWFAWLFSIVLWAVVSLQKSDPASRQLYVRRLIPFAGIVIVISLAAASLVSDIPERIELTPKLFNWNYWKYTFEDKQNFGFLGIMRLEQLETLTELLKKHPLTGIGFAGICTDFHGLYFILLGASGIPGLVFFLYFGAALSLRLAKALKNISNSDLALIVTANLSALLVWLSSSLLQSMLIHFSVWIVVLTSILMSGPLRHKGNLS